MATYATKKRFVIVAAVFLSLFVLSGCAAKSELAKPENVEWLSWVQTNYDKPLRFFDWTGEDFKLWSNFMKPLSMLGVLFGFLVSISGGLSEKPRSYAAGITIMLVAGLLYTLPQLVATTGKGWIATYDPPLTLRLAAQAENWPGHDGTVFDVKTLTEGDLNILSAFNGATFTYSAIPMLHKLHFFVSLCFMFVGIMGAAFSNGKIRFLLIGLIWLLFNFLAPWFAWGWFIATAARDGDKSSIITTLLQWNMTYPLRAGLFGVGMLVVIPLILSSLIPTSVTAELSMRAGSLFSLKAGDDKRNPWERVKGDVENARGLWSRIKGKETAPEEKRRPASKRGVDQKPNRGDGRRTTNTSNGNTSKRSTKNVADANSGAASTRAAASTDKKGAPSDKRVAVVKSNNSAIPDKRDVAPVSAGTGRRSRARKVVQPHGVDDKTGRKLINPYGKGDAAVRTVERRVVVPVPVPVESTHYTDPTVADLGGSASDVEEPTTAAFEEAAEESIRDDADGAVFDPSVPQEGIVGVESTVLEEQQVSAASSAEPEILGTVLDESDATGAAEVEYDFPEEAPFSGENPDAEWQGTAGTNFSEWEAEPDSRNNEGPFAPDYLADPLDRRRRGPETRITVEDEPEGGFIKRTFRRAKKKSKSKRR